MTARYLRYDAIYSDATSAARLKSKVDGSRVVSVLDSGAVGPEYKSQPRRCRVTVLGKLFTSIVPLFTKHSKTGSSPLKGCGDNCRPGGK